MFKRYTSALAAKTKENAVIKFALVVLAAVTVMNYNAISKANESTRTVIVPMGLNGALWITNRDASDDYILGMARLVTWNLNTYTAASMRYQMEEVLKYWHPDSFATAKAQAELKIKEIEQFPSITSYAAFPNNKSVTLDRAHKTIEIKLRRSRVVGSTVSRQEDVVLTVLYEIENARFYIKHIEEEVNRRA